MDGLPTREDEVDFSAPGTWYTVIGELDSPPLIVLHGGPGTGHEYMITLTDLYKTHKLPIVLYDQVGCGRSTHFKEKAGDASFWTMDLFLAELDNLVDHLQLRDIGFSLLGQSWGGILTGAYASRRPKGLKRIIIAGGPASMPLYAEGCKYLLSQLPEDVRRTIEERERKGDYESEEFQKASAVFYGRHFCKLDPLPEPVQVGFEHLKEDPTAYLTFKTITKVRWVTLSNASHMTHWEHRDKFNELCGGFLFSGRE
ncbi:hypothetical protein M426DRAFT_73308 [Hypoxylon sp. CI-4A]|nr:hypothetical protein M426DRAFT_73308 [Hypoxylon sp. CI-4A]